MNEERLRVVVDTNLWISLLIGGKLGCLLEILVDPTLELISTPLLKEEIMNVAHRPKFRKYFSNEKIDSLMNWMNETTTDIELDIITPRCRDPKDDYLLELAIKSHAIYLVSGDSDLLDIGEIENCKIMTFAQFEEEMKFYKLVIL